MIIFRYLFKEMLTYFVLLTVAILLIFVSNTAIRLLSDAAEGGLASTALIYLIFLQLPFLLGLLLPICLFFGILLAYGRLYINNEMTVLFAAGVSQAYLVRTALLFGVMVAVMTAALMVWVAPFAQLQVDSVGSNKIFSSLLSTVKPGAFEGLPNGQGELFVGNINADRVMKNVFLAHPPSGSQGDWVILSSSSGGEDIAPEGDSYVFARDGFQYSGFPGHKDINMVKFGQVNYRIDIPKSVEVNSDIAAAKTQDLINRVHDHDESALAELQWRLSMPLTALIFSLLAVPLSRVNPRQGKFAYLVPAIFIAVAYANALFIVKTMVSNHGGAVMRDMWLVHAFFLLLTLLCYLYRDTRWRYAVKRFLS